MGTAPAAPSGDWPVCKISYTWAPSSRDRAAGSLSTLASAARVSIQVSRRPGASVVVWLGRGLGTWLEQLASRQASTAVRPSAQASLSGLPCFGRCTLMTVAEPDHDPSWTSAVIPSSGVIWRCPVTLSVTW